MDESATMDRAREWELEELTRSRQFDIEAAIRSRDYAIARIEKLQSMTLDEYVAYINYDPFAGDQS